MQEQYAGEIKQNIRRENLTNMNNYTKYNFEFEKTKSTNTNIYQNIIDMIDLNDDNKIMELINSHNYINNNIIKIDNGIIFGKMKIQNDIKLNSNFNQKK